jgi:hypothetical protein
MLARLVIFPDYDVRDRAGFWRTAYAQRQIAVL